MRITWRSEGGVAHFPGLARATTLDTEQLPADEAEQLTALVRSVLEQPDVERLAAPPRGAADYQTYVISVDDGATVRELTVTEMTADEDARRLIDVIRAHA